MISHLWKEEIVQPCWIRESKIILWESGVKFLYSPLSSVEDSGPGSQIQLAPFPPLAQRVNCQIAKMSFFILKCFWPPPSSPVLTHGSDSEPARRVPKYDCASLIRNNLLLQKPQINFYLVVCASSISIKNRFGIHSPHETINKKQKHLRLTLIVCIVFFALVVVTV